MVIRENKLIELIRLNSWLRKRKNQLNKLNQPYLYCIYESTYSVADYCYIRNRDLAPTLGLGTADLFESFSVYIVKQLGIRDSTTQNFTDIFNIFDVDD